MTSHALKRRDFIKVSAVSSAGLALGGAMATPADDTVAIDPNNPLQTWIEILSDNTINLTVVKADLGQGIGVAWAQILGDELNADWDAINIVFKGEEAPYLNPRPGSFAATFGSTSVRYWYELLLTVAATARAMLIQAAAMRWQVSEQYLVTYNSRVYNFFTGQYFTYGELVLEAAALPVPQQAPRKNPVFYSHIGRAKPTHDVAEKVKGEVVYAVDVDLPDMLYASVRQSPVFGGALDNLDALYGFLRPGQQLIPITGGVIVAGSSWWEAEQTLTAMPLSFTAPEANAKLTSDKIHDDLINALARPGIPMFSTGDVDSALASADKTLEATYSVPFLAHSPLEPMSCTAYVRNGIFEIWVSTQSVQLLKVTLAGILGLDQEQIIVHVLPSGGSFGRRVANDFVIQAVFASLFTGKPVNLLWSREEDTQHDQYRPTYAANMKAGLIGTDLVAWLGKNAGQFVFNGNFPFDPFAAEGFAEPDYQVANLRSENVKFETPVPVGFWRSVGLSHNTFFLESFIDEVAVELNEDPFWFRKRLLGAHPRQIRVLEKLALLTKFQFPEWRHAAHGLAIMNGFDSIVGMVAEVRRDGAGIKVEQIWCVVDCGRVINPDGAQAQIEGGIVFGLSACLYGEITLNEGRVEQKNFSDYPVVKLDTMPKIRVHFIHSNEAPGGLGEAGVPAVAPAVCNAIYKLTGERIRHLPVNNYTFN